MNDKVMIGIAVCGDPAWEFVDGLFKLDSRGFMVARAGTPDRPLPIQEAYNHLVRQFLSSDADWLWNVNQDCLIHPQTLNRLLSWNKPIISPLAFTRYKPTVPMVYSGREQAPTAGAYVVQGAYTANWIRTHKGLMKDDPTVLDEIPDDSLFEITEGFVSTHCLLIRRDVLEAMPDPWFVRVTRPGHQGTGCDRAFCEQAQKRGFNSYVDYSQIAGHLVGHQSVGALTFMAWDAITEWSDRGCTFKETDSNG